MTGELSIGRRSGPHVERVEHTVQIGCFEVSAEYALVLPRPDPAVLFRVSVIHELDPARVILYLINVDAHGVMFRFRHRLIQKEPVQVEDIRSRPQSLRQSRMSVIQFHRTETGAWRIQAGERTFDGGLFYGKLEELRISRELQMNAGLFGLIVIGGHMLTVKEAKNRCVILMDPAAGYWINAI